MKVLNLVFVLVISFPSVAQLARPLQFREESYDFGEVVEKNGPVTHQFEFTNKLNRPVKIIGVKPSCGCTTPDWTKEPVMPGMTGFIQARFDPKGRPGYFTKSLTVTTDADSNPILLHIKGTVAAEGKEAITEFAGINGNWKIRASSFNLGKIYMKDEFVVREYPIMNNGKKSISYLDKFDGPSYIKAEVEPKSLAPGERGVIRLSYNGKLKGEYGFQSDNVTLHTDDEQQPQKSFAVFATIEDYFPALTPDEITKAPKLQLSESTVDFGRIKQNQSFDKDIFITNTGKTPLQIKAVQGNCTCITTTLTNKNLKAGAGTSVKVSFNPQDRKGTQQKAVTIYSNDPVNPVQRITLAAYVED